MMPFTYTPPSSFHGFMNIVATKEFVSHLDMILIMPTISTATTQPLEVKGAGQW